jgi:hypothetical protein
LVNSEILTHLKRLPAQIVAVQLKQVERIQDDVSLAAASSSNRESPVLGQSTTASPSIVADHALRLARASPMRGYRSDQS